MAPLDSDSEDDGDYVPPAQGGSSFLRFMLKAKLILNEVDSSDSESEGEPVNKRPRTASPTPEDAEAKKKAREELWKSFKDSINAETSDVTPNDVSQTVKLVKIEKRYRFAGEDIVEVVEVPEDSQDAKKWPLWTPASTTLTTVTAPATMPTASEASSKVQTQLPVSTTPAPVSISTTATSISTPTSTPAPTSSTPTPTTKPKPPPGTGAKRPGPRKSKITLASLPSSSSSSASAAKPTKLTTLEKSAMDWRANISSVDGDTQNELEAHRKAREGGGGYLEKVEFLERVSERREGMLDASRSGGKRRRMQMSFTTATSIRNLFSLFVLCALVTLVRAAPAANDHEQRDIVDDVTAGVASVFGDVTQGVASIFGDATSIAPGVFETITSIGGKVATIITSEGGEALTLVESGAGKATSIAGSLFTVATGALPDNSNAAGSMSGRLPFSGLTSSNVAGMVTVVAGAAFGAVWTLI
ncbi:hypothetical protein D9758_009188 [Tetrapyrgos nigripes]|uniref:SWR1-complex protein 5 n=1 Tax=Tetrapyrgos nigripes TaxID=182062 RepID=A0A8H5D1Z2_9AGAR|nr:hypothetical protein D9758_009188 [Tetrapyrgos nigripes]